MMPAHHTQDACAPLTAEGAEDFAEERKEDILTRDHDDQIQTVFLARTAALPTPAGDERRRSGSGSAASDQILAGNVAPEFSPV